MIDLDSGSAAVRIARAAIEFGLSSNAPADPAEPFRSESLPAIFDEHRGVFVTLTRHPSGALRGCIGYPRPAYRLRAAIPRAAVGAAVEDPRFPALTESEVPGILVEVSILTVPKALRADAPPGRRDLIEVGRHGLVVTQGRASGLLLPQVATEFSWTAEEFLAATCRKAGLPDDAWRSAATRVDAFEAEVFGERTPGGPAELRGASSLAAATTSDAAGPRS